MNFIVKFSEYELYLIFYILFINLVSYYLFKIDKKKARNKQHRISENTLIFFSLIGGGTGGLISMVINKHKLSKEKFYKGIPIIILINNILILLLANYIR